ncbi:MAG: hypothetical protein K2X32_11385 [Phycisphaerales bacterium]|nr:hypothetical protein [Phycisphaerales bacterium]
MTPTTVPIAASPSGPAASSTPTSAAAAPGAAIEVIAPDGYPTGNTTAEGVACDLARSFIHADADLFIATCLDRKYSEEHAKFLDAMAGAMRDVKAGRQSNAGGPTSIARVWKARNLSRNGPASAGFTFFNFSEVKFVDVGSPLTDGTRYVNRTLVVQLSDGTWRVIPDPENFGVLAQGLNSESDSTEVWTPASATPPGSSEKKMPAPAGPSR